MAQINSQQTSSMTLDQPITFKHIDPIIEFDINDVCPGQPFTGTMTVIGAGGPSINAPPLDVVISIDSSGSMSGGPLNEAKKAAIEFVNIMAVNASNSSMVGIVGWNGIIQTALNLTNPPNNPTVLAAINALYADDGTNLNVGLQGAIIVHNASSRLITERSTKAIVLLTDGGEGTYSYCSDPLSVAAQAKAQGIIIYSIGISTTADNKPLADMANCTGGKNYPNISADTLDDVFAEIYQAIEDSTVPYNITVNLFPMPGIDNFTFLDSHVLQASSQELRNIDDGKGLPNGSNSSFLFQGNMSNSAVPTELAKPESYFECKDKDSTEIQRTNLTNLGVINISPDCKGQASSKSIKSTKAKKQTSQPNS